MDSRNCDPTSIGSGPATIVTAEMTGKTGLILSKRRRSASDEAGFVVAADDLVLG